MLDKFTDWSRSKHLGNFLQLFPVDDGFNFPSTTTAELQEALAALMQNDELQEEEVEEEVIGLDWEELEKVAEML